MSSFRFSTILMIGSSLVALAACGGGGSGSSATNTPPVTVAPPPPPPAQTFVTVEGRIDGFGSIIVNGTRYNTDSANVRKDGRDVNLSELSVGQIVAMRARRNGEGELPTALRVRYEEVLEGPVSSIAADRQSLVILEQTVFLTDETIFEDGLTVETIAVDDVLEVSGSFNSDGDIVASYVEISDDVPGEFEVHGTVGGLDADAQTFRIKGLRVGYATAELADFEDGNVLSNGDKVEVEGSVFTNDGTLIATRVEYEGDDLDELEGDEGDDDDIEEAEIEGFISAFTDATAFEVNGKPVITNATTEFERCAAEDLALDVEVEVEGEYNAEGVLVADKVQCEIEANVFIEAIVDAVSEQDATVTLLGVTVGVDSHTAFQDKSDARIREFGLDDIMIGDALRIQAYEMPDETGLTAKKIRRESLEDFEETELKGAVDAIDIDFMTVAGVTVIFGNATKYEIDEIEVSRDEFIAQLMVGDRVKVEGSENEMGDLVAEEIELERDDDDDEDSSDD